MEEDKAKATTATRDFKTEKPKTKDNKQIQIEHIESVLDDVKEEEMEVIMDVRTRTKKRYEALYKDVFQAKSKRFPGAGFATLPPKLFMAKLETSVNNGVGEISFNLYEKDASLKNKKYSSNKSKQRDGYGNEKTEETSGEYPLRFKVIEKLEPNRPLTRNIVDMKEFQNDIQAKADRGEITF